MWHTSKGDRTLSGAEAQLIRELIAFVHDEITIALDQDDPYESGVALFDDLQPTQQLALLLEIGSALLDESRPVLELTAVREAAVYALFCSLHSMIEIEIDLGRLDGKSNYQMRSLAIAAIEYSFSPEELRSLRDQSMIPDLASNDIDEWQFLIESLADRILWDRDFDLEYLMIDQNPENANTMKRLLGIDGDHYAHVAPDPKTDQLGPIHEQLRRLRDLPAG